jgi:nicotinamidase-related amidase
MIKPPASSVLIVVDVQIGFCAGGHLAVADGEAVVPVINRIATAFDNIVITQDWHPPRVVCFQPPGPQAIRHGRAGLRRAGALARALRAGQRRRRAAPRAVAAERKVGPAQELPPRDRQLFGL